MAKTSKNGVKKRRKAYLDYASGVLPNASSIHNDGVEMKNKLEKARSVVASVLSCRPNEVIFTSGGTEANNLAIQGITLSYFFSHCALLGVPSGTLADKKNMKVSLPHIITTNIEHSSVLETFRLLEKRKLAEVSIVGVEESGIVDPKKIRKIIKENTVLVSVMYANNEIGTIQPIKEIAREIRHFKKNRVSKLKSNNYPIFHTDAVQAVNYLDLNVDRLGVDLLSLSGSKIEGAGRVGILYKKNGVALAPIFGGGDQEMGLRPGTENILEISRFAEALSNTQKIKDKEFIRLGKLQKYFLSKIKDYKFIINGDIENRLPNNINITIPKIPSDLLVIELSMRGIMVSSKSACKSGDGKASYVLEAIRHGAPNSSDLARLEEDGSIRFSFGRNTKKEDIDYTLSSLKEILTKLKKWYD